MDKLVEVAKNLIDQKYKERIFQVGSALLTKSGKIYTGISINSQKINVCAEWPAIGKAFEAGDLEIIGSAAVMKNDDGTFAVLPPCSLCRDLFSTYAPEAEIFVSENKTMKSKDLLPYPWEKMKLSNIKLSK